MITNYSILSSGKYFSLYGSQIYLVSHLISSFFTSKIGKIGLWQSKGMSEESITPPSTTNNSFDTEIIYNYGKRKAKIKGICLKQETVSFIHGNVVNLNISYELDTLSRDLNTDFALVITCLEL